MSLRDTIRSIFGGGDDVRESPREVDEGGSLQEVAESEFGEEGGLKGAVAAALGGLESLAKRIPGYHGYKEKEMRREADKLLRTEVARKLDDERKGLSELQVQLVSQGQIEHVDDLERAVMKLQLLIDRIKTASYGYAGLFDAVKVKEEQLDALYDFDNQMLDVADEIATYADRVSSAIAAKEGVGASIGDLVSVVEEANTVFGHREEAILQAGSQ
jgi:hypothetical protein